MPKNAKNVTINLCAARIHNETSRKRNLGSGRRGLSKAASCFLLLLISFLPLLCRCYAIKYPLRARSVCTSSRAKRSVVIIWALAGLLAAPILRVQVSSFLFLFIGRLERWVCVVLHVCLRPRTTLIGICGMS